MPIVRSAAGGARGGGSLLTEQGTALLEAYQNMSKECAKLSNWLFQEYFSDDFVEKLQNRALKIFFNFVNERALFIFEQCSFFG